MSKRIYAIAGETSGDQHLAAVINQLKLLNPDCKIRGMGGDGSAAAGQELVLHQKEMAVMGIWEVLVNLRKISKNLRFIKEDIAQWKPDAVLLVDYPGFNFKIAKYAHNLGIPVHYYISPKVWAWKESRVELIRKHVDKLYSILPFEPAYFATKNIEISYVGNPSKEAIDSYLSKQISVEKKKQIALLPGSRAQEIRSALPIMLEAIKNFDDYDVVIAQAPGFDEHYYAQFGNDLRLVKNDMYGLLAQCEAALVTSGTATLETALMGVPQVVCYKISRLSYEIGKRLIKVKYISLVNLILDKACIAELIQDEFNAERISSELAELLVPSTRLTEMKEDYAKLNHLIGDKKPSVEVAKSISI